MKNNPLVVIGIPVYNVRRYMRFTIESVLNQTYQNIEIILSDDGSNDGSEFICDEYADNYPNITVLHNENGGLPAARNRILDYAEAIYGKESGVFLMMPDSDDIIAADCIEKLIAAQQKSRAKIVATNMARLFNERDVYHSINAPAGLMCADKLADEEALKDYLSAALNPNLNSASNKLFQLDFLLQNNLRFLPKVVYEDIFFIIECVAAGADIEVLANEMYLYRSRYNSETQSKSPDYPERIAYTRSLYEQRLRNCSNEAVHMWRHARNYFNFFLLPTRYHATHGSFRGFAKVLSKQCRDPLLVQSFRCLSTPAHSAALEGSNPVVAKSMKMVRLLLDAELLPITYISMLGAYFGVKYSDNDGGKDKLYKEYEHFNLPNTECFHKERLCDD